MTRLPISMTPLKSPATWAAMALTFAVGCGQSNDKKNPTDKPTPPSGELAMLEVGADAPDFTAEAHDGTTIAMKDMTGQPVVVYFYPKDATPG